MEQMGRLVCSAGLPPSWLQPPRRSATRAPSAAACTNALLAWPPHCCSRKDTGKTARMLALKAQQNGEQSLFDCTLEEVRGQRCCGLLAWL